MPPSMPQISPARFRSYMFKLPLFTRLILFVIFASWIASFLWNLQAIFALTPNEIKIPTALHRTQTYTLVHAGFLHALLNAIALTPLLERFEAEHGTITSAAVLLGPLSQIPAAIYVIIERGILGRNTPVIGSSIWVFLFLAVEAMKTYRTNPHFQLGTIQIPTWITPLVLVLFTSFLIPNTSFLGHLCGLGVGYLWAMNYLNFLKPPEWALRWIEGKLNLLGRVPHYVSVDQKTYGRFGVLPTSVAPDSGIPLTYVASTQRLGP